MFTFLPSKVNNKKKNCLEVFLDRFVFRYRGMRSLLVVFARDTCCTILLLGLQTKERI